MLNEYGQELHRAVKPFLFLEDRTIDFWLIPSLSIKEQSQCVKVEKAQILEADSLPVIPGSYSHRHMSLGKSFSLVSLFVNPFVYLLVTMRIQWNNKYGTNK